MIYTLVFFFIISIVLSMVGMGGGVLYVPLLLFSGYDFREASTLSLFLITVTGLSAFGRFSRAKLVDWQLALVMELFTGLGAFTGGLTSVHFNGMFLKIAFGVVLIIAAYFMFRSQKERERKNPLKTGRFYWHRKFAGTEYSINILQITPVTFLIGYMAGLLGIAGGVLKVPIMILWFGIPAKIAVATSSLMVSFTGLFGLGGHLMNEPLDWKFAAILGVVVFAGAKIGSRISLRLPEKKVKLTMAVILTGLAVFMIVKTLWAM
jgi:uncharacterized membrane protein YfcA